MSDVLTHTKLGETLILKCFKGSIASSFAEEICCFAYFEQILRILRVSDAKVEGMRVLYPLFSLSQWKIFGRVL
jgi:hypothetical protein